MEDTNLFGQTLINGVPSDDITQLFNFWKTTFNKRATTVLDDTRTRKLSAAIKAYGIHQCQQAILGCSLSAWHTGHNPRNKQYTDITLIFRNAEKVEMFINIYETETASNKEMDQWLTT